MDHNHPSLFDPAERDACGTGFVADLRGVASHDVLADALHAVGKLEHRGAVSPDGRTSDGAGVLTQIPWRLLGLEPGGAIAQLFLHPDRVDASRELVEAAIARCGLRHTGWREVPFDLEVLGRNSLVGRPAPWQLFVDRPAGLDDRGFDRVLHRARRLIESNTPAAVVVSFSRRTIVYKGLVVPALLPQLFPDLDDAAYETALALFHQRYSTNTSPSWALAQPFSFLAHNGEINTLRGNLNRMAARQSGLRQEGWGDDLEDILPIVRPGGSDSSALDDALSFLVASGRDIMESMAMLVPEAYEARPRLTPSWRAFAQYNSALMEPWDGPASLVFTDGELVGATLDRNGLRPLRYWLTEERIVVASEAGVVPTTSRIIDKGRLGPGEMLFVDTANHRLHRDREIKAMLGDRRDYLAWSKTNIASVGSIDEVDQPDLEDETLARLQKTFGYGREHVSRILEPMGLDGAIPIGSMGDDAPLAVLSEKPQRLYGYFMQRFAQVTNPAIDPLRERLVMSLTTRIALDGQLLEETMSTRLIEFETPIVSAGHLAWLERGTDALRLDTTFAVADGLDGLEAALDELCTAAEAAVVGGQRVLILSDRAVSEECAPIPMLLATSAVNHHLVRVGHGAEVAIVCDTADVIEDHDVACLLGFGATLVHPWLAYESVAAIARKERPDMPLELAAKNYRTALQKGLRKIMAKLGIADVNSYRGAQTFEALGIAYEVVEKHFAGCPSRIGGATLRDIAANVVAFHDDAHDSNHLLQDLGLYRFRRDGEYHAFHPGVFKWLHKAVREQDGDAYARYAEAVDTRPPTSLRDLLRFDATATPIPIDEVEPAEEIARRFCTQAMSFGSLSRETHELLAVAMNQIGGKSNSGEGGEEPVRLAPYADDAPERSVAAWHPKRGDVGTSAIKQVASGRFGVTPDYLVSATQLEIKMAQGSKPGEGGQIPGFKVTEEIAATRRAQPGMPLISPPPHHDIYSIEDLAQLIYDLKRVNERATVAVKLVSVVGIGTIATGVAKGYADAIQVSGHDGGTGASPLGSIKHAGLPWEMGLGEVQQRLVENDLRGRITLRVDGGLKTGRDVVVAAMLGAEEFGFGTAALVAAGCVMARQCHANTCPVGVATQREDLRARFPGKPEHVIAFMMFVAEHVRFILASLGARTLDEIVGRVDLLVPRDDLPPRAARVDLSRLLWEPSKDERARRRAVDRNDRPEEHPPLDQMILEACVDAWPKLAAEWLIDNSERSVGARLSGEIARRGAHLDDDAFDLRFVGQSGQSFGAFLNRGMRFTLVGEAQDYVAKGMAGGQIVVVPPPQYRDASGWVIMGNTCAYGATGGRLFVSGVAGERLAVRNSGAVVVTEGCGDHGCEYMTGGTVVVLGKTGLNFGAGMTGGHAFVWDPDASLDQHLNADAVTSRSLDGDAARTLERLLHVYAEETASPVAAAILERWPDAVAEFRHVEPHAAVETGERRIA